MERFCDGPGYAPGISVVGFDYSNALRVERTALACRDLGVINDLDDVGRRSFLEEVPSPSERRVDQHRASESAVIPDGPVPCAVFPLGVRRSVVRVQRAERRWIGVGGVARNAGLDGVPVIDLKGQLAGVVIAGGIAIDERAT